MDGAASQEAHDTADRPDAAAAMTGDLPWATGLWIKVVLGAYVVTVVFGRSG